jgi:hypothetical protein
MAFGRERLILVALVAVLSASGCNRNPSGRLALGGDVTLDGVPLESGSIQFMSTAPGAAATGAVITAGRFDIPADKGLPAGKYTVSISSPDEKAPPVPVPGTAFSAPPERIPREYNVDSQQMIEVTADGDNDFEFNIRTKPGPS